MDVDKLEKVVTRGWEFRTLLQVGLFNPSRARPVIRKQQVEVEAEAGDESTTSHLWMAWRQHATKERIQL